MGIDSVDATQKGLEERQRVGLVGVECGLYLGDVAGISKERGERRHASSFLLAMAVRTRGGRPEG
jgi:hypothetical protein